MTRRIELTGRQFDRLTVLGYDTTTPAGAYWRCRCICGCEISAISQNLREGRTRSCGCKLGDANRKRLTTHGMADKHPLYATWTNIRGRCYNPRDPAYSRYGGVGIRLCDRWHDFANFVADVGERPVGTSLDRWPDPHGDYEPGNWRWASPVQQRHNRRDASIVWCDGMPAREYARINGVSPKPLITRIRAGQTPAEAVAAIKAWLVAYGRA